MCKIFKRLALIGFLFCSLVPLVFAEDITITTYYPAPYGSYQDLTVADREAIGDVSGDGKVDINDLAEGFGTPFPGSLTVAGRIAIGIRDPGWSRLRILGQNGQNPSDWSLVFVEEQDPTNYMANQLKAAIEGRNTGGPGGANNSAAGLIGTSTGSGPGTNMGGYFFASGATNNYAIEIRSPNPPGANDFAIYSRSPVKSFFNGSVGIGTEIPTTNLQVVGLPAYANNAAAVTAGLTVGAFYRCSGTDHVCVVY